MNYNELQKHAETCQMAADELAHDFTDYLLKSEVLSRFQSHCEPNLFFIYSIWPEFILHIESIDFMLKNKERFKRKLKLDELLRFDFLINAYKPKKFDDFALILKGK